MDGLVAQLRTLRADDLPTLRQWWTDPRLAARSGATLRPDSHTPTVDMFRAWSIGSRSGAGLAVASLADGELVGHVVFHVVDPLLRAATLTIVGDAHHGQGYEAEAVQLATRYGFTTMDLRTIEVTAWVAYDRGVDAYASAGFVEVTRAPDVVFCDGAWHDQVVMQVMRYQRLSA